MVPFDQTAKSIKRVERMEKAGKIDKATALKKIAALKSKGPVHVARWILPSGKEATQVCRSAKEARQLEAEKSALVRLGESSTPKHHKAPMREVFSYYLENHLKGRTSYPNAKPHLEKAAETLERLGSRTLDRFDANAERLLSGPGGGRYGKELVTRYPETFGSESSLFNHRLYVHSAVAFWIKMRRVRVINPYQIWVVDKPDNARKRAPTFAEYKKLLALAAGPRYHPSMRAHVVLYWEHGRRLSEHASLTWEGVHLNPPGEDLPWVHIRTLKQGGRRQVWHEMPLTYEAALALKSIYKPGATGPVFAKRPHTIADWNRKLMAEAGFKDLRFHDFRRAYRNRNDAMDRQLRKGMQGRKTDEMDDHYLTEQRRALEPAVRNTYPGDPREMKKKNGVFA